MCCHKRDSFIEETELGGPLSYQQLRSVKPQASPSHGSLLATGHLCEQKEASELTEASLGQWFPNCAPEPVAMVSPGQLVTKAHSQAYPRPTKSETLGMEQTICIALPGIRMHTKFWERLA